MKILVCAADIPRTFEKDTADFILSRFPLPRGSKPDSGRICSRALLMIAAGTAELPEVAYGKYGKPYFPERADLCFSMSHTEGTALCAVSKIEVGADIERVKRVDPLTVRRMGADNETDFFREWTRRESRAKCLGTGAFAMPMKFKENEDGIYYQLNLTDGCMSCVFCAGSAEMITRELSAEEFASALCELKKGGGVNVFSEL